MNIFYVAGIPYSDELYHHGIKGQKWGVRRYRNEDGTLTNEGIRRYRKLQKLQVKNEKFQKKTLNNKMKAEKRLYKGLRKRVFKPSSGKLSKMNMEVLRRQTRYDQTLLKGKRIADRINSDFENVSVTELEKYRLK